MIHSSYKEYLESEWWKQVKHKTLNAKAYKRCQFCDIEEDIHLHHTSYKWINTPKELCVIIPLCKEHHYEVHKYAKDNSISIRVATNRLRKKYKPNWMAESKIK